MSKLLITGVDGSLGKVLAASAGIYGFHNHIVGMPRSIFKKEDIDAFIDDVSDISVAILNDGTNHLSWIGDTPEEDAEIIERNLLAPYWTLNALARKKGRPCRVVIVTSQTYRVPQRTTALYCASKAGLTMMMRVAARELAPHGWVINAVAPGKIEDTEMSRLTDSQVIKMRHWVPDEAERYALGLIPAGRFTTCSEITRIIYQTLMLPSYVNGTTIEAFGGV